MYGIKTETIAREDLEPGMVVLCPATFRDFVQSDDGPERPITDIFSAPPLMMTVEVWAWEDGETWLRCPSSGEGLDLNTAAYPETFERVLAGDAEPTILARLFGAAGFQRRATGGGCDAWVKTEADRVVVVTADDDSAVVPDRLSDAVIMGVYGKRCPDDLLWNPDDEIESHVFDSVAECLARFA